MYCDFTPKNENKLYLEVENVDKLREVIEGHLEEFNNMSKKPMNLVIFRFVVCDPITFTLSSLRCFDPPSAEA